MHDPVAVILAAGKSTRMKSAVPKVLHDVCGRPMIEYVLESARNAGACRIVVVVGYQADQVRDALSEHPDVEFALQAEQHGTGHAVMVCEEQLKRHDGPVLILAGDTPLLRAESLSALLQEQREHDAVCVIGTAETDANEGLGRIVRDSDGEFLQIVEQRDTTPEQAAIREINAGCYAFDCRSLLGALGRIRPENDQGEYYLTDCPAVLKADGKRVVASRRLDIVEAMGVNTRVQLAEVERTMQRMCLEKLMLSGVTIVAPDQTYVDPRAVVGPDTVIDPFTSVTGPAVIGRRCRIGPHAVVQGDAQIPDGTAIGPFEIVTGE